MPNQAKFIRFLELARESARDAVFELAEATESARTLDIQTSSHHFSNVNQDREITNLRAEIGIAAFLFATSGNLQ